MSNPHFVDSKCPNCLAMSLIFKDNHIACTRPGCWDNVLPELMHREAVRVAEYAGAKPQGYAKTALAVGDLLNEKNKAYGNSFDKCQVYLALLYPNGVPVSQYQNMLTLARDFDKSMRIANDETAFGEEPWKDKAGYALLMVNLKEKEKNAASK